jgi:MerR family transcriptional regulator, thiopeptide resistance regulator
MTVSMLARRTGLSRTSLLYYESQGLLRRPLRTSANYRTYSERDVQRVQQIQLYRKVGLSVREIGTLLDRPESGAVSILEQRMVAIDREIEALRNHQRAILRLLKRSRALRRHQMMTKDKWVGIMQAAGFSEQDMRRWHAEFEHNAPQDHQEFLEYLGIEAGEIVRIRDASRKGSQK